ncbi:hypothetical protein NC651_025329 [Populus alba x Populus x berolinensis]|nr:hypothetical protein NC651_025329 [Populus alba x Populus x berolinensis]
MTPSNDCNPAVQRTSTTNTFDCYTHLTRRAEDQPRNLGLVTCHDRTSVSNHRIIRIK